MVCLGEWGESIIRWHSGLSLVPLFFATHLCLLACEAQGGNNSTAAGVCGVLAVPTDGSGRGHLSLAGVISFWLGIIIII